jgi:nucleoside 2-deoxyribosyltransferase
MVEAGEYLRNNGFEVILPELTRYQHIRDEFGDDVEFTKIKNRLTIENMANVEKCDCLLVLNHSHRGFENYVGGNSFLEMIVAFYLKKPIYLLNPIPEEMTYTEEIKALYPIVVHSLENFIEVITK